MNHLGQAAAGHSVLLFPTCSISRVHTERCLDDLTRLNEGLGVGPLGLLLGLLGLLDDVKLAAAAPEYLVEGVDRLLEVL